MLSAFSCPHCQKALETDQPIGQIIPCPHCGNAFCLQPEFEFHSSRLKDRVIQLCIPVGYVLFVLVPMLLTFQFFMNKSDEPLPNDDSGPVRPEFFAERDRKKTRSITPEVKPVRKPPPDKSPPTEEKRPDPTPPAEVKLARAPFPRERAVVEIAPEPKEVFWKLPLLGYQSPWQKVGAVDIRIAGIAIAKVPFVNANDEVLESANPMFVLLIEARLNTSTKKRELRSWSHFSGRPGTGVIFLGADGGNELPHGRVPPGNKPHTGLTYPQRLPADGTPIRDVLLFSVPPKGTTELNLRLDADRCGESGDVWFKIPASSWK